MFHTCEVKQRDKWGTYQVKQTQRSSVKISHWQYSVVSRIGADPVANFSSPFLEMHPVCFWVALFIACWIAQTNIKFVWGRVSKYICWLLTVVSSDELCEQFKVFAGIDGGLTLEISTKENADMYLRQ